MRLAIAFLIVLTFAAQAAAARTREPDVEFKDVGVKGRIEGENISFTLDFTAKSRVRKPEIALVSGDLVLETVPGPRAREEVRYDPASRTYYMSWRGKGKHTDTVSFACRPSVLALPAGGGNPTSGGEWREATFAVPASNCRTLELVCDRTDLEVRFPDAVKLEREVKDGVLTVTALLGPGRPFAVRWKPEVQKLEAKLVMACEANTIVRAGTGALRVDTFFAYDVSQGSMTALAFSVPGALSVTQVRGVSIQDWHIDAGGEPPAGGEPGGGEPGVEPGVEPDGEADGAQELTVTLNRKQTERYALQVTSEMVLREFPVEVVLPVIAPKGVIRASGHLAVGTDSALKVVVKEPRGLSQIDASAFPRYVIDRRHPRSLPRSNAFFYSYATSPYEVGLSIDDIVPSYDASERFVMRLPEDDLVIDAAVELDIRDSAIRAVTVVMDKGLIVAKVEGAQVADYSVKELPAPATTQEVEVQFAKPVIGRALITLKLELGETPLGKRRKIGPISVRGARNERGYIAIAPEEGVDLDSPELTNLREVHTGSIPMRVPGASHAYRFRSGDWSLSFLAKKKPPQIRAEAFHLVSIGEGIAYGSVAVSYFITGAPLDELRFRMPKELANVEFVSRDVRRFSKAEDDEIWTVELQRKIMGDYNLLVTYNQRYASGGEITVGGVEPEGVDSQTGYVCVASRFNLKLTPKAAAGTSLRTIDREEVPFEYRRPVNVPILRSYKYAKRPHGIAFTLDPYDRSELVAAVVDMTQLDTQISVDNKGEAQSRTTVTCKVKNAREQFLALGMPKDVRPETVHIVDPASGRARRVAAGLDREGNLMVPLERRPDPNMPTTVRVVYTSTHGELGWGGRLVLAAPASGRIRSAFADWTVSAPLQAVRERGRDGKERIVRHEPEWAVYPAGGTIPPDERPVDRARGLAGLLVNVGKGWRAAFSDIKDFRRAPLVWIVALVAAAALVAVFFVRRRALPVAAAGALLAVLVVAGIEAERRRPDAGARDASLATVSFARPLGLDGAGPEGDLAGRLWVGVRLVPPWRRNATLLGAIVAPVLALAALVALVALAAAAFRRRDPPPPSEGTAGHKSAGAEPRRVGGRPLLVALAVALLLYSIGQFPDLWPVLGNALTWGAPAALALAYLALLARRLAPFGQLGRAARAPAAAVLVLAALLAPAGAEAGESKARPRRPARVAPPAGGHSVKEVSRADYVLVAEKDHMKIAVSLVLDAEGPMRFPVMPGSAILTTTPEDRRERYRVELEGGAYFLDIKKRGAYGVTLEFLSALGPARSDGLRAFRMAMPRALTNSVSLEIPGKDLQVESPTAVRLAREEKEESTVARAAFGPSDECIFLWKPRARETKLEKTSFFAEVTSLVRFDAGLAECLSRIRLQIAQGEMKIIRVKIPEGMTVTGVEGADLGTWRFDPAEGTLEARLAKPASGQYDMTITTQITADGLPYTVTVGSPGVLDAERQRGAVGLAATSAVFVEATDHPAPMNVDDFVRDASGLIASADGRKAEVRHAYRYHRPEETVTVQVNEVRPEIRTTEDSVFSVEDDRLVYNGQLVIGVAKSGLFSAALVIPEGYDIDSLSGPELSHWDEETAAEGRLVRLHLRRKFMGAIPLKLAMSRAVAEIPEEIDVPRVGTQDALKVTGTMRVKSERGVRLSVSERKGVSEIDPLELERGRREEGMLAFKLLRPDWGLKLKTEVVEARQVVTFLHEADVSEGLVRHRDRLRFRLYNAGTKSFEIVVPEGAVSLEITGPDIAKIVDGEPGADTKRIELASKWFDTRGAYPLDVRYETGFDDTKGEVRLVAVRAVGPDLQRGHVAVRATAKVELTEDAVGEELRLADARTVGRAFGVRDLSGAAFCYSASTANYDLVLRAARHGAAELLGARVRGVSVSTIVTERGESISQVWMRLVVGAKRYLRVRLPEGSDIWTLVVNNRSVTPSSDTFSTGGNGAGRLFLVPLGQAQSAELPVNIDFVYVSPAPSTWSGGSKTLAGPSFDLPLSNIEWRLFLPRGYEYDDFEGSLTVETKGLEKPVIFRYQPQAYDAAVRQKLDQDGQMATQFLTRGKDLARKGLQTEAKQAFESAVNLSASQYGLNEDARVQLDKVNRQQAIMGLVGRRDRLRSGLGGAQGVHGRPQQELELGENFSPEQAERVESSLAKDDYGNLGLIAGRLMKQQERAAGFARALKVHLDGHGQLVRLSGAIQVKPNAEMAVSFEAAKKRPDRDWASPAWAAGIFVVLAGILALGRAGLARRRA